MLWYNQATIYFPEWSERFEPSKEFEEEIGKINGNIVSFTRNGCFVEAQISPHNIPYNLSSDTKIQEEIVKPAIELVTNDIETIEDLFDDLREIVREGKLQENLFYKKETFCGEWFRVYDYMGSRNGNPFRKLQQFKGLPSKILKSKYVELPILAESVHQPEQKGQAAYVECISLRKAVEKALTIYQMADKLQEII